MISWSLIARARYVGNQWGEVRYESRPHWSRVQDQCSFLAKGDDLCNRDAIDESAHRF